MPPFKNEVLLGQHEVERLRLDRRPSVVHRRVVLDEIGDLERRRLCASCDVYGCPDNKSYCRNNDGRCEDCDRQNRSGQFGGQRTELVQQKQRPGQDEKERRNQEGEDYNPRKGVCIAHRHHGQRPQEHQKASLCRRRNRPSRALCPALPNHLLHRGQLRLHSEHTQQEELPQRPQRGRYKASHRHARCVLLEKLKVRVGQSHDQHCHDDPEREI
mmetsp:Transcript_10803/g.27168  ORF Transcript_10803/g.27168 Transcript_10803/m.27168 type:complete len:215 (+) Transcript_10803:1312-1956(+)